MSEYFMPSWVKKELTLEKELKRGSSGKEVKKIQEWLVLNGEKIVIDSDFGKATEFAVREFQERNFFPINGIVDQYLFSFLTEDLTSALWTGDRMVPYSYDYIFDRYTENHLDKFPREVGGQNMGPWVRVYMKGNEGKEWAWCNGFVSFMLHQINQTVKWEILNDMPYFFSVDIMVDWAKKKGLFVPGSKNVYRKLEMGDIFVCRNPQNDKDWTHTGFVTEAQEEIFNTVEGNTNDDGDREGYELCNRLRGYKYKDFIKMRG